jgi:hypothetical protein
MAGKQKRGYSFWKKHYLAWQSSGLRQPKYCAEAGISIHAFRKHCSDYGVRKHSPQRFVAVPPGKLKASSKNTAGRTSPSTDDGCRKRHSGLKLQITERFHLDIAEEFSVQSLVKIIRILESL